MDTLAAPMLLFRRRSTLERVALDPALELGAGGEAVVYEVPGDAALVAKVYHVATIDRARKLTLMLANPPRMPEGSAIAWPTDLLLGPDGFAGFLMPRAGGPRVFEFYNPVSRRATAPAFHAGLMHRAGRNLAAAFDALHAAGYVVGDVNESNLLVSPADASVTLVDADSMQVRDAEAGTTFRSRVGKPEFTPPELQGVSFTEVDRAPEHDRFGLGVLLFLLLMEGTHPFATRMAPGADALPVEERIRAGHFPHARLDDDCHPPRMSPRFDALHLRLRALFVRCFVAGHADPAARPTAAEWRDALEAVEEVLDPCAANPQHRYHADLGACPWCERAAALGGRDPFPADAVNLPAAARPRPRRVRMAAPFVSAPAVPATPAGRAAGRAPLQGLIVNGPGIASAAPARAGRPGGLAVFGPSGLRNPLVWGPASAVLGYAISTQGGAANVFYVVALIAAAQLLLLKGWRNVRLGTVALAVCMAVTTAAVLSIDYTDWTPYESSYETRYATTDDPVAGEIAPLDPSGAPAEPGQSVMYALMPDLVAAPLSEGVDPGPPPVQEAGRMAELVEAKSDVEQLPVLTNPGEAARALAFHYPAVARDRTLGDTAMLWLHVSTDGQVIPEGWQLIRSTSAEASDAATATVPYLRFEPARKGGVAVGTWVTQRFVIVP